MLSTLNSLRETTTTNSCPASAPAAVIFRIVVATPFTSSNVSVNHARLRFYFRSCKITGKLLPERHVCRLEQVENFSGQHSLSGQARFFREREFGWIASFHKTRKHFFQQCGARPELFVEMVFDETGDRIVEAVRQGEGSSTGTSRAAIAAANVFEKFCRRLRVRRFRKSRSGKLSAVIIRAADENLFPRLSVRGRQIMAVCKHVDFLRRQLPEKNLGKVA